MKIEFDEGKNLTNIHKHHIFFTEAKAAIIDPLSIHLYDEVHSIADDRCLALGNSDGKILDVSFTLRGEKYRIISARKATKKEEEVYFSER